MDVGSSSGMRLEQWGSILWAFEQNELWGNPVKPRVDG